MQKGSLRTLLSLVVLIIQSVLFNAFSQKLSDKALVSEFNSYAGKAFQEKLYLHTDREFYIAGEIVWFKIYYVDGSTHQPLQVSKLAYVEILNEKNEPVTQAKISLDTGEGSFYLPTSLGTGNYIIRAYTNWMKNFDERYFFEKRITVVNTLKNENRPIVDDPYISVNFFPEGGNLVNDIQSKIGFIVSDRKGGLDNFVGYIIDRNGDTVNSFAPLKFGIGSFYFKPVVGNSYRAIITRGDSTIGSKGLPNSYTNGYVMSLNENNAGQLVIKVYRRKMPGEKSTQQVILAGHTRQVLHIAESAFINDNDSTEFIIDKEKLGEGITQFTLFTEDGKPVCERLFYRKPAQAVALRIKSDREVYDNRQKINLQLETQYKSNIQSPLDLSVSVFHADSLQLPDQASIFSYMWLVSDLGGPIESPDYYFSKDPDVAKATDNLMLTHGWRRFKWEDVLKGGNAFIKYMPEVTGYLVAGRVIDTRTGQPARDVNAYLSITGKPFGFYTSMSDKNGLLWFEVRNYYGNSQVFAQPGIGVDSFYRVDILKPYVEATTPRNYPYYIFPQSVKEQLLRKSIGMQVQNIYSGDSLRNFQDPIISDTLPFYGYPEISYALDDYKRFTTMEEVLREYVREIGVGIRNEKLVFKIFNPAEHDFYNGNELVLLDGVAITNAARIFKYDPLKVKKIDVIRDRYIVGKSIFNGLASFSTYDGKFDGFELNPRLVAIDYSGLQLHREFYSPVYETSEQLQKRIPDFRNTLFWSPSVVTGKDGKAELNFYSSDLPGKYLIVVQGMSKNGDFVSGQAFFEVK